MNLMNYMILFTPMIMNSMLTFFMMFPTKMNKFHPISFMLILIIITFLICLKMNFLMKSIIPFTLFLMMIGGLMIIFMYITSLINNELFSFNFKLLIMNFLKIIPMLLIILTLLYYYNQSMFIFNFKSFQFINEINNKYINIMYKESNNNSTIFIMIYLYYSMICIMNICYKFKAPLRQLYY